MSLPPSANFWRLAVKSWTHVLKLENDTSLAAQAHFGLATIYRKQGKTADAEREMEQFHRLQKNGSEAEPP
jgi:ATP/maltotriose-dependent transcriptional regulator MalT